MRVLLLLITFLMCYLIDPAPTNSLTTRDLMTADSAFIEIDYEYIINSVRIFTY